MGRRPGEKKRGHRTYGIPSNISAEEWTRPMCGQTHRPRAMIMSVEAITT
jgi:hypothetical protein